MGSQSIGGWQTVDRTRDPQEFVRYLKRVSDNPRLRENSLARLRASGIEHGSTVLDLGCGIGSNTLMLAEHVGPSGLVRAVDRSRTMIETTARRAREGGLRIVCDEADAASLPFGDDSFDAVWIERVLMHVPDPLAVMREARRVLHPAGRFVVMESEAMSLSISDGGDPALARRMERHWIDGIAHPRIGQALESLALQAGFGGIRVEEKTAEVRDFAFAADTFSWQERLRSLIGEGSVTGERAERWLETVRGEAERDQVICSLDFFEMVARP